MEVGSSIIQVKGLMYIGRRYLTFQRVVTKYSERSRKGRDGISTRYFSSRRRERVGVVSHGYGIAT